jgi:hypothetical protein
VVLLPVERLPDAVLGMQLPARVRQPVVPLLHAAACPVPVVALDRDSLPLRVVMPLVAVVSLSVLVGLSTAASP